MPADIQLLQASCQHSWVIVDKTLMKSAYARLGWLWRSGLESVSNRLLQEKLVITVQCKFCGEIKQFVQVNPEIT